MIILFFSVVVLTQFIQITIIIGQFVKNFMGWSWSVTTCNLCLHFCTRIEIKFLLKNNLLLKPNA